MNRILKKFIDDNSIPEVIEENFNYEFDKNSNTEKFEYEYKKFI